MSEEKSEPQGLSRRSIVSAAAWATPVIVVSAATPAMAASPESGVITWIPPEISIPSGTTASATGLVTVAKGTIPAQVSLVYFGTTVTGPATAAVNTSTGYFSVPLLASVAAVSSTVRVIATAPGFSPAVLTVNLTVAGPTGLGNMGSLIFTKHGQPSKIQPQWSFLGRRTQADGLITESWSVENVVANKTNGILLSGKFDYDPYRTPAQALIDPVMAETLYTLEVIETNNPEANLFFVNGDSNNVNHVPYNPRGIGGVGSRYRARIGYDGLVPASSGSSLEPGDKTYIGVLVRPEKIALPGNPVTKLTLRVTFDELRCYQQLLYISYK